MEGKDKKHKKAPDMAFFWLAKMKDSIMPAVFHLNFFR